MINYSASAKSNKWLKEIGKDIHLYIMIAPVIAGFFIFSYLPMYGTLIAFQDYDFIQGVFGSEWIGLKNFNILIHDPYFYRIIKNTVLIGFYVLVWGFWPPILLALLLNEIKIVRFKKWIQTISYLPYFIAIVIVVGMLTDLLSSDGIINSLITAMGGEKIQFFSEPGWFRTIYVTSDVWQTVGWGSIIYLAALTGVSPDLYESAVIDGASRFQQAIHITIPSIMPIIRIMLIFAIANVFSVGFEKVYLMYNPSTYPTSDVIATYVYRRGILGLDYSFGAAIGLLNSVIAFILLMIANTTSRKISGDGLW